MDKLVTELTRALASDDFDTVVAGLPAFQEKVHERLAQASDDREREQILAEAIAQNRRWRSLAHSLRSHAGAQIRTLEVESRYAEIETIR